MKTTLIILYVLGFVGTWIYLKILRNRANKNEWADVRNTAYVSFSFFLYWTNKALVDFNVPPPKWLVLIFVLGWMGCGQEGKKIHETSTRSIYVYTIDGCEYIGSLYLNGTDILTHKGNCKFCTKRNIGDTLK